jgi:hypothetical protein
VYDFYVIALKHFVDDHHSLVEFTRWVVSVDLSTTKARATKHEPYTAAVRFAPASALT